MKCQSWFLDRFHPSCPLRASNRLRPINRAPTGSCKENHQSGTSPSDGGQRLSSLFFSCVHPYFRYATILRIHISKKSIFLLGKCVVTEAMYNCIFLILIYAPYKKSLSIYNPLISPNYFTPQMKGRGYS
jgi:hypothetical protein